MIQVLLFAGLQETFGQQEIKWDSLPETVGDLKVKLIEKHPELEGVSRSMVAVNEEYAEDKTVLKENDTVAFIPPVSGG
ncbi:molybdopterin converting factor subunit 1 [Pseudalkalibacillus caeni]|uniref:Molybdopterin synthase sulfur carrier subunit n=1 Tax=Exobacillus caeni TaxID=2574798 RepID=A0A5R9F5S3_9BACL|nr:molybdopterin converting factor subunit 1 [Pseudalkalibacillus caeni]TLS37839.1 molybdopterin converting factor subunit 1 [Pseudalkalibacillus caeni]